MLRPAGDRGQGIVVLPKGAPSRLFASVRLAREGGRGGVRQRVDILSVHFFSGVFVQLMGARAGSGRSFFFKISAPQMRRDLSVVLRCLWYKCGGIYWWFFSSAL